MNEAFEAFWATCCTFFIWPFKKNLQVFPPFPTPLPNKTAPWFLAPSAWQDLPPQKPANGKSGDLYVNQTPFSDIPSLPMPKTMWHLGGPLRLMRNSIHHIPNHRAGGISGLHNLKASMDNFNFIYWYGSITHSVRDIAAFIWNSILKAPLSYTSFLI